MWNLLSHWIKFKICNSNLELDIFAKRNQRKQWTLEFFLKSISQRDFFFFLLACLLACYLKMSQFTENTQEKIILPHISMAIHRKMRPDKKTDFLFQFIEKVCVLDYELMDSLSLKPWGTLESTRIPPSISSTSSFFFFFSSSSYFLFFFLLLFSFSSFFADEETKASKRRRS